MKEIPNDDPRYSLHGIVVQMVVYRVELRSKDASAPRTLTRRRRLETHQIVRPHQPIVQAPDSLPDLKIAPHGVVQPAHARLAPKQLRHVEHVPAEHDVAAEAEEAPREPHRLGAREVQRTHRRELARDRGRARVGEDRMRKGLVVREERRLSERVRYGEREEVRGRFKCWKCAENI